ncbi:acetyltransferase [Povalibacter uvarum]|uniref:Acetyltransferase n=1 Tax=Povalibacter uvarum TaxID=732238 RepID=A0A841HMP9_9GAMM|nr:CoA-binding protein [Povalibacter uvarum]MBB6093235.1 acetyltransferase [Povalibacter uvarum]
MRPDAGRLQQILQPCSVAIAGAAERETSAGGAVLRNLIASGFDGRVVPVNPKGGQVLTLVAMRSLAEVAPACDLAVVAVRPDLILGVIREGVASGHRNFLVLPGGFQEAGAEGKARDAELRAFAASHDVLIMGPNCAGLINILDPRRRFAGTFFKDLPFRGIDATRPGVAFVSQSGAIAEEVIASSHSMQIPVGSVVSIGNGMHLGLIDFISGLASHSHCSVAAFYAESVGDPHEFVEALQPITARKPVVGLIGGTTSAGAAAAKRHTGSTALSDDAAEELCRRAGIVRVKSLRQMLIAAKALAYYPQGIGSRVLILSNSGGPGVLAADRCEREGLRLAALPDSLAESLRVLLPPEAAIANPIDLLADAREDRFGLTLAQSLQHAGSAFDAILMTHVVPFMVDAAPVIEALARTVHAAPIPVLHSMMGTLQQKQTWFTAIERAGVPMFDDVEEMASAAGLLAGYARLRAP